MEIQNIIPERIGDVVLHSIIYDNKLEVTFNHTNRVRSSVILPSKVDNDKLFLAGLAIFASEGTNKFQISGSAREVEIVNSNPALIKTFLKFLDSLDFSKNKLKAKIELTISSGQNSSIEISRCEEFWSKITGLERTQFTKPIIKIRNSKSRKSENGSLILRLYNRPLFRLLTYWSKNLDQII